MRWICHKQKAVRFHRSDSNSPISCSNSPLRGPSYETRTAVGLWVFTRDSSTRMKRQNTHRTTHPRLKYTLWHMQIMCSHAYYTQVYKQTKYGCKHSWLCLERWQRLESRAEWLTTVWGWKYYCPWGSLGISSHGYRPALINPQQHKHTWARYIKLPLHTLFENAIFITNPTQATVLCQLG